MVEIIILAVALFSTLVPLLAPGNTVVDGGNSNYKDTSRRARMPR